MSLLNTLQRLIDGIISTNIAKKPTGSKKTQAFAELELGPQRHKLRFKLDTGADVNTIPTGRTRTFKM